MAKYTRVPKSLAVIQQYESVTEANDTRLIQRVSEEFGIELGKLTDDALISLTDGERLDESVPEVVALGAAAVLRRRQKTE